MPSRKPSPPKPPVSKRSPGVSPGHRPRRRPLRAPPVGPSNTDAPTTVREIVVGFDEEAVANAGIAALAACPELFTHAGQLVTLVPRSIPGAALDRSPQTLRIERLPTPRLRELLSRSARWLVPRTDDPQDHIVSHVPQWVVAGIAARREWPGLRPLAGLIHTPVLRSDGTVLETPGYDPATGLYLTPNAEYPRIAARPTLSDARAAADLLVETVTHVPFATAADRAAWLTIVLTIFARFAVGAASPLYVVEDSRPASWTNELVDHTASIVGLGPVAAVEADDFIPAPRRWIDLLLAQGESLVVLRNPSVQTPTGWRRIREVLERSHATSGLTWCTTLVRAQRDLDLLRTGLSIRCESSDGLARIGPQETPHRGLRQGPTPRLAVAALTMLRAYQAAGVPDQHLVPWSGFERWSHFIRSAVVWCGYPDPVLTNVPSSEPTTSALATDAAAADLVLGWADLMVDHPGGCSARQALDALSLEPTKYPRLQAALKVFAPGPLNDRSTADRLGRCLTRLRDVEHEGYALVFVTSGNQGNRWTVRPTTTARGRER